MFVQFFGLVGNMNIKKALFSMAAASALVASTVFATSSHWIFWDSFEGVRDTSVIKHSSKLNDTGITQCCPGHPKSGKNGIVAIIGFSCLTMPLSSNNLHDFLVLCSTFHFERQKQLVLYR